MSTTLYFYTVPGRYVLVRGLGVRDLFRAHNVPAVWSGSARGHMLRKERFADAQAIATEAGHRVVVRDGEAA